MIERKYSFENFAIGRANQLAYLSVKRTLKSLGIDINPLFIYSKKGLGKTHLLSSVKETLKEKDVLYLDALELESIPETAGYVLILENIHLLPDEVKKGMDLYNFIKSFIAEKNQVYITSVLPPGEIGLSEQLVSLIKRGLSVPIFRPDSELVARVFKMISGDFGITLNDDVIQFLSVQPFNDIREIETVLKKLDLLKDVTKELTVEIVRDSFGLEEIVEAARSQSKLLQKDSEFFDFVKDLKEGLVESTTGRNGAGAIKEEYMQKLYIWKMKGFNIRRLEKAINEPLDVVIQTFGSFTSDVQRLIELQRRFGELDKITTPGDKEYFEKSLFDPDAISDIEKALERVEERKRRKEEFYRFLDSSPTYENFVVLPSNREAFEILKKGLPKGQKMDSPIYIYGDDGCGKTHLLMAFTKKMQSLNPEEIISYIPSDFLTFEIKNLSDRETKKRCVKKLSGMETIFFDDIENVLNDKETKSLFFAILKDFSKEKKNLIISSTLPPETLDLEDKLKEIFLRGNVISIRPLDEEDKKEIITNFFGHREIPLSDEIMSFLSKNLTGKFIDIQNSVEKIMKEVVEKNRELTIENISDAFDIKQPLFVDEAEREKEEVQAAPDEKILLSELDIKWPYLNERIFEDFSQV